MTLHSHEAYDLSTGETLCRGNEIDCRRYATNELTIGYAGVRRAGKRWGEVPRAAELSVRRLAQLRRRQRQ